MKPLKITKDGIDTVDELGLAIGRIKGFSHLLSAVGEFVEHSYFEANQHREIASVLDFLVADLEKKARPILMPQVTDVA